MIIKKMAGKLRQDTRLTQMSRREKRRFRNRVMTSMIRPGVKGVKGINIHEVSKIRGDRLETMI